MWPFDRKSSRATETKGIPLSALINASMVTRAAGAPDDPRSEFELVENNLTAAIVVRRIASAAATIKFHVNDEDGNPEWEHPVSQLLDVFDPDVGRWATLYQIAVALQVTADAYLLRTNGARGFDQTRRDRTQERRRQLLPQSLQILDPTGVQINPDFATNTIRDYTYHDSSGTITYLPEEIVNIRHYWPTEKHQGVSILRAACSQIRAHNSINKTQGEILDNGALPPAIVTMMEDDNNIITDDQFAELKEHMQGWKQGGDRQGTLAFLRGKYDILEMPRASDLISLDSIDHLDARVAAAFGYPYVLLRDGQGVTFENQRQAEVRLWTGTIVPIILDPIASALSKAFGLEIGYDLSDTPVQDSKINSAWDRQEKAKDITTIDERRAMIGLNPLPNGAGDIIFRPATEIAYQGGTPLEPQSSTEDKAYIEDLVTEYLTDQRKMISCDHFNVFPDLKDGDFLSRRATFRPDIKNV